MRCSPKNYLGNAIENSIWAVAFFIVGIGLCRLLPEFDGAVRVVLVISIIGIAAYLASPRRLAFNESGIFRHYPELDDPA